MTNVKLKPLKDAQLQPTQKQWKFSIISNGFEISYIIGVQHI